MVFIRAKHLSRICCRFLRILQSLVRVKDAILFLQLQDALHALIDARFGNGTVLHHRHQAINVRIIEGNCLFAVEICREQQDVHAGLDHLLRNIRTVFNRVLLTRNKAGGADRVHLKGICHDDAVKAKIFPQDLSDHLFRHGCRIKTLRDPVSKNNLVINQRICNVRRHDHVRAVLDRGLKGHKLHFFYLVIGLLHGWGSNVAVNSGISMPREVLVRGDHAGIRQPVRPGRPQRRDRLRIIREGTRADDRICRVVIHINVRREINIESDRRHLFAKHPPGLFGIFSRVISGRPNGHASVHPGSAHKADDDPALFIHRHEIRDMNGSIFIRQVVILQILYQTGYLAGLCHI